jgi:UDP-3-O-[3-hydroxymyristoyl] glucosamine N-acyltransferase
MKLSEIINFLNLDCQIENDKEITSLNTLIDASNEELTFLHNPKYVKALPLTKAGAILIEERFASEVPEGCTALVTNEPYLMMAKLTEKFVNPLIGEEKESSINNTATILDNVHIGNGAVIGENSIIMSGAFIGENVKVGKNTVIYPNVTVYNDTVIGDGVKIHAGSVIGSDGFGYAHTKDGKHIKIYHLGSVEIQNDVEIGSNSSVDRGVFGKTIIKEGAKIDNLVQVGHNCEIGEYSIMVAQSGMAGSSKSGRNVVMGGQAAVAGHLEIAPFTTIAARGGVTKSIKEADTYSGFPLMKHKTWLRLQAKISGLLK